LPDESYENLACKKNTTQFVRNAPAHDLRDVLKSVYRGKPQQKAKQGAFSWTNSATAAHLFNRLEACKLLGRKTIECRFVDASRIGCEKTTPLRSA
jgi:hypothetical protein